MNGKTILLYIFLCVGMSCSFIFIDFGWYRFLGYIPWGIMCVILIIDLIRRKINLKNKE